MKTEVYRTYAEILNHELIAALGCTEPIAIAYAGARVREVLGCLPEHIRVSCSGNIIKNVKGVIVPNSGGQRGIAIAAILGVVGGKADGKLQVLQGITDDDRAAGRKSCCRSTVIVILRKMSPISIS